MQEVSPSWHSSDFHITVPVKARWKGSGAQVRGWISSQTVYQYFANGKAAFLKHQEGREDTDMNKKIIKRLKTSKVQEIALCIYKQN